MKSLIKQHNAEYVPAVWDGVNRSGLHTTGKTVLVLMDECSPTTSGGIELVPDLIENMTAASIAGVLVAVAEGAFCVDEDGSPFSGRKPQPGDRVNVAKYAGTQIPGRDGRMYRLMDYGCIGGVYLSDEEYAGIVAPQPMLQSAAIAALTIDDYCAELGVSQIDGPPGPFLEVGERRYVYLVHRVEGATREAAERALALSVKSALVRGKMLIWRARPTVEHDCSSSGWSAYCRFVQADCIASVGPDGDIVFAEKSRVGIETIAGVHDWDPETMRCRRCRFDATKPGEVVPPECEQPDSVQGAARA